MDPACLACQTIIGVKTVPGGAIAQNQHWLADHCLGPFGIKTKVHRENLWDLTPDEAASLGPFIQRLSGAIVHALGAERVYVSLWVDQRPYHVHFVLQPRYPGKTDAWGLKGWKLQAFRLFQGKPDPAKAAWAVAKMRDYLTQIEPN